MGVFILEFELFRAAYGESGSRRSLHAGYEALFTQKSREAMGAAGKVDGCATFWKAQKYRVAEQRELRFNDLAYAEARGVLFHAIDAVVSIRRGRGWFL